MEAARGKADEEEERRKRLGGLCFLPIGEVAEDEAKRKEQSEDYAEAHREEIEKEVEPRLKSQPSEGRLEGGDNFESLSMNEEHGRQRGSPQR